MFETGGKLDNFHGEWRTQCPPAYSTVSFLFIPILFWQETQLVHHPSVLKTSVYYLYIGWFAQTHFKTVDILILWNSVSESINTHACTQIGIFVLFLLTWGAERKI